MKKTISMFLAVLMAAIAVCTFSVIGFADEADANDDPVDNFVTEATTAAATTKAPETTAAATTKAPETTTAVAGTTAAAETTTNVIDNILGLLTTKTAEEVSKENEAEEIVTAKPGVTFIDDGETTKAPATTKKPAKVESNIPSTGSTVVPVIALLALAAGTVAVVKTKKED
ncbi:MAG: hypothetical protein IJE19_04085 [Clostridia bacterium]|nr:hypothetical protein [Clostridia bacterium]